MANFSTRMFLCNHSIFTVVNGQIIRKISQLSGHTAPVNILFRAWLNSQKSMRHAMNENFIDTKRSPKQQKDFFIKIVPMGSKGANTGTTNAQKYKIKSTKSWLKIHLLYKSFEWYVSWIVLEWIDMNGFNKCLNVPAKWFHFISSFPVASTCKDFCDEMLSYYSCFNVSQQSIVNLLH